MNPAIVAALIELGIELEKPLEDYILSVFERNPAEEERMQLALERAVGDKRAEAKFGPLPPSTVD